MWLWVERGEVIKKDVAVLALLVLGNSHSRHRMPLRVGFLPPKCQCRLSLLMLSGSCSHHIFPSHYFLYFSSLNWENPKKAAVLFEEFSVVNDPFFFLDESWILL